MADKFKVAMVTPTQAVASGDFTMVVAPATLGQVGILPDHRPLLTDLDVGVVELRDGTDTERYAVAGGFLEVAGERVVVLAEAAERADQIDVQRSQAALADAEQRLQRLSPTVAEYAEQVNRRRRAQNRLSVAGV